MMHEYLIEKETLLARLHTNPLTGLDATGVRQSAAEHGPNTLTRAKRESLLLRLWHAATEPMILMLIAAGVIALVVNIIQGATGGEADFLECVGIFAAIALSVVITVVMEGRSAKAFEALNKINEDVMVKVLRGGSPEMLNQKDIVVGDILLLATGDKVPADGRLIESTGLAADESALTGESLPAAKDAQCVLTDEKTPLAERCNMLYTGTYITGGLCKLVVTAVGDKTEFGRIAKELAGVDKSTTPLQEKLARLGKAITLFGVIAAAVVFVVQLVSFALHEGLILAEVMEAFVTSIVLIVAAVPEGLPTIVAVSLSINIIKLSRQNALVKKMIACETVGCVNVICSDKTGTLTENKMTVAAIWDQKILSAAELDNHYLLENFCVNSTADLNADNGLFIGNPTEGALLIAAKNAGMNYREERAVEHVSHVFPFSSEEKHMTTVIRKDKKAICYTKGSPERILSMCSMPPALQREVSQRISEYQKQAYRILAFSHKEVPLDIDYEKAHDEKDNLAALEENMIFDGFAAIADPLRADVYEAVNNCRRAGVELKILTGDNIVTATAIANELRLLEDGQVAVEAGELEPLSDEELCARLPAISVIARSTPAVKMRVVKLLKGMGNVVAVTGDGINDAPALKNADVGIAMGISGTEVSKEASDMVLLNDSFSTIVRAIEWGRGIYENFKRFISFQLTVNVSSVIVVLSSILLGLKAPFTALQLLWINIIMDGPPALTLGLEPAHGDLMRQPPVKRNENIISKAMMRKIGLTGLYISAVFLLQYTTNFLSATAAQMPTVLFTLFALFQLFNAFNCRELNGTSIFKNLLSNRLMLLVISITFAFQIIIIQFGGAFFGTIPLSLIMWLKLFAVAFSVVALSELIKLAGRMLGHR